MSKDEIEQFDCELEKLAKMHNCPVCGHKLIVKKVGDDDYLDMTKSLYCEHEKMSYSLMAFILLKDKKKEGIKK